MRITLSQDHVSKKPGRSVDSISGLLTEELQMELVGTQFPREELQRAEGHRVK